MDGAIPTPQSTVQRNRIDRQVGVQRLSITCRWDHAAQTKSTETGLSSGRERAIRIIRRLVKQDVGRHARGPSREPGYASLWTLSLTHFRDHTQTVCSSYIVNALTRIFSQLRTPAWLSCVSTQQLFRRASLAVRSATTCHRREPPRCTGSRLQTTSVSFAAPQSAQLQMAYLANPQLGTD